MERLLQYCVVAVDKAAGWLGVEVDQWFAHHIGAGNLVDWAQLGDSFMYGLLDTAQLELKQRVRDKNITKEGPKAGKETLQLCCGVYQSLQAAVAAAKPEDVIHSVLKEARGSSADKKTMQKQRWQQRRQQSATMHVSRWQLARWLGP